MQMAFFAISALRPKELDLAVLTRRHYLCRRYATVCLDDCECGISRH
jgi:hypothetical protein